MGVSYTFCPGCGAAVASGDQRFCASCGRPFGPAVPVPAVASAVPPTPPVPGYPMPPMPPGYMPMPPYAPPPAPPSVDWGAVGHSVLGALMPFVGWVLIFMVVALGALWSNNIKATSDYYGPSSEWTNPTVVESWARQAGRLQEFPALTAYSALATSGLSLSESDSGGSQTVDLAPWGALFVLFLLSRVGTKYALRARRPASAAGALGRITLAAFVSAGLVYLTCWILLSIWGQPKPCQLCSLGNVHIGPGFMPLLTRVFPVLWLGGLFGGLAVADVRQQLLAPFAGILESSRRTLGDSPSVILPAAKGYLWGLGLLGFLYVAYYALAGSLTTPHVELTRFLADAPQGLVFGPNYLVQDAVAATGTAQGYMVSGSVPTHGSWWDNPQWWHIAIGALGLAVPALVAGWMAARRSKPTTFHMIFAGLTVVVLLAAASVLVEYTYTQTSRTSSTTSAWAFDMGRFLVVAVPALVISMLAGAGLRELLFRRPATAPAGYPMPQGWAPQGAWQQPATTWQQPATTWQQPAPQAAGQAPAGPDQAAQPDGPQPDGPQPPEPLAPQS